MITICQKLIKEPEILSAEQAQPRSSTSQLFHHIQVLLRRHPLARNLARKNHSETVLFTNPQNYIKPKMFQKLITWMAKFSSQTLEFSNQTFEISVNILKNYLAKVNEPTNVLQMLGCISLHLSSKVNEKTIISTESYMECCMNIFTKEEFEKKEAQIYLTLGCEISTLTTYKVLDFLTYQMPSDQFFRRYSQISAYLKQAALQLNFIGVDKVSLVCNLIAESAEFTEFDLKSEEFLSVLKSRTIKF